MAGRKAALTRRTNETQIELSLDLDGTGTADISTGVGFYDHMLTALARHGMVAAEHPRGAWVRTQRERRGK